MNRYRRRKRSWWTGLLAVLVILCGIFACWVGFTWDRSGDGFLGIFQTQAQEDRPWNLILVNKDNPIPKNYSVNLLELSNGEKVDERIYPKLQEMFDAARADGIYPVVVAGYRTHEVQQRILDEKIQAYKDEGYSRDEAKKLAESWVAVPGTSEHELGIAVDINADTSLCTSDALYTWLADNAYKYGFIYRYPQDKTDITGVINEPWHYRYVGVEAAKEIYDQGVCLEEYLGTEDG